jgi:hypothetical protein
MVQRFDNFLKVLSVIRALIVIGFVRISCNRILKKIFLAVRCENRILHITKFEQWPFGEVNMFLFKKIVLDRCKIKNFMLI